MLEIWVFLSKGNNIEKPVFDADNWELFNIFQKPLGWTGEGFARCFPIIWSVLFSTQEGD